VYDIQETPARMEIVTSDDDDDDDESFFDTVMMLCQDFFLTAAVMARTENKLYSFWGIYTRKASNIEQEKVGSTIVRYWNTYHLKRA
jgi:hypothetical protein